MYMEFFLEGMLDLQYFFSGVLRLIEKNLHHWCPKSFLITYSFKYLSGTPIGAGFFPSTSLTKPYVHLLHPTYDLSITPDYPRNKRTC